MTKGMTFILVAIMLAALAIPLCSCKDGKIDLRDALESVGIDNNADGSNREQRIKSALAKARDAQKQYNMNRSLAGLEPQPEGTVYVVEVNGYFIQFEYRDGDLRDDINPEELPTENPLKGNDKYTREKDKALIEKLTEQVEVRIYLPKD